jgi:hypothetical protein
MASQVTTLFTAQAVDGISASTPARSTDDGRLRVIVDSFTTTSALTAGSHTIALCKLPKGAKVVSAEIIVPASVGTSSAKLGTYAISSDGTLGSAIDDDAYGSGKDLSSAGRVQFITTAANSDRLTTQECALVLSPVTTDFATSILFSWIIQYTVGN